MISWRRATVLSTRVSWRGAVELHVEDEGGRRLRALAFPAMVGTPEAGDTVLLNTTAVELRLGTGGYAMVIAIPDRLPADSPDYPPLAPGHMVKARYTPQQVTVLGVDEQDSPHHDVLATADDLGGMPVVVADLHSALPAVLAGVRAVDPTLRVAYVMTDGGALPRWFSRSAAELEDAGWISTVVTVGHAFGGDLDAVSLHTGLLAARHVAGCDLAVVAQGPGNLGTGTAFGFSGVAVGEALNAAAVLGGRPIAVLRVSEGDARERHFGVSHHSLTAIGRLALAPCEVVVPDLPGPVGVRVHEQAASLPPRHARTVEPVDGLLEALREVPVRLSTMGRGLDADAASFLAAAAAGRVAARACRGGE